MKNEKNKRRFVRELFKRIHYYQLEMFTQTNQDENINLVEIRNTDNDFVGIIDSIENNHAIMIDKKHGGLIIPIIKKYFDLSNVSHYVDGDSTYTNDNLSYCYSNNKTHHLIFVEDEEIKFI